MASLRESIAYANSMASYQDTLDDLQAECGRLRRQRDHYRERSSFWCSLFARKSVEAEDLVIACRLALEFVDQGIENGSVWTLPDDPDAPLARLPDVLRQALARQRRPGP